MTPEIDKLFAIALACVHIALVFVLAFFAAKRRGRRAWVWAALSWFGPFFLILSQLRHRSRTSVAPDWLGWVNRYSFIVIALAGFAIFIDPTNSTWFPGVVLLIRNWAITQEFDLIAMALEFFYAPDLYTSGRQFYVNDIPISITDGVMFVALSVFYLPVMAWALSIFRMQPATSVLMLVFGLIVCAVFDVAHAVTWISFYAQGSPNVTAPWLPIVVCGLVLFWGSLVLACWCFPDVDPNDPDLDLTSVPPLPASDEPAGMPEG